MPLITFTSFSQTNFYSNLIADNTTTTTVRHQRRSTLGSQALLEVENWDKQNIHFGQVKIFKIIILQSYIYDI